MQEAILEVKNLSVELGNKSALAVENVSFSLYAGKTLALVGESGCGKTMTALSILQLQAKNFSCTGEILYRGNDLLKMKEKALRKIRGSKISMIFQDPMSALNPVYTINDQMMELVLLHLNIGIHEAQNLVFESLKEVGLKEEIAFQYPHTLSGGMKQRVMIAMSLMCKPDIVIADEPSTALDVTVQSQVLELIKDLQKKYKMALLLVTHDMGVVAEMADSVIVMYASRAVEKGPVKKIFYEMDHPYTKGLFLSRPHREKTAKRLPCIEGSVPSIHKRPEGCFFMPRCKEAQAICKKNPPGFRRDQHISHCWFSKLKETKMK